MMRILLLLLLVAWAEASARPSLASAQTETVEVEPVTCWWRTDAAAVRVGEDFTVVLTCAFLQTEAARVVADESRLEPSVVQIPPFEVVGGSRAKDLSTATRRFVQFEYRIRIIAENVFASEAALPPLEITYRVESRVAGADSVAGRDLTYALPPLTMRVLSLVPDTADDIREAPVATFAEIESEGSRASLLRGAGGVAVVAGLLMLALATLGAVRRRRAARPAAARSLKAAAVLTGIGKELNVIRESVRASGWTSDLAGRALAAIRLVAAYASGRAVTQRIVNGGPGSSAPAAADGQLMLNGRLRTAAVVFSSATTSDDEEMRDALARFEAARYGREARFDAGLDDALDAAIRRAERLTADRPLRERLWPR